MTRQGVCSTEAGHTPRVARQTPEGAATKVVLPQIAQTVRRDSRGHKQALLSDASVSLTGGRVELIVWHVWPGAIPGHGHSRRGTTGQAGHDRFQRRSLRLAFGVGATQGPSTRRPII